MGSGSRAILSTIAMGICLQDRAPMRPFPERLFRGDRDADASRQVREVWQTGYLRTNLVDGNAIWSRPFVDLVRQHVEPGWRTTHFLSFSEDRARAEDFARGKGGAAGTLEALPDDAAHWDTAVFTLDTSRFIEEATRQVRPGIWLTAFEERPFQHSGGFFQRLAAVIALQNRGGAPVRVLLINVVSALGADASFAGNHAGAIAKAQHDREWLVLPIDPFPDDPSQFTCVLSGSCLSSREKFLIHF